MLKPTKFNINIIYECPTCRCEHWFNGNELKTRPILMCCNEIFEIQPIHNVSVNFKFNKQIPDGAIQILKGYGFTIREIKDSGIEAKTCEDYIKKFLASQKQEN